MQKPKPRGEIPACELYQAEVMQVTLFISLQFRKFRARMDMHLFHCMLHIIENTFYNIT